MATRGPKSKKKPAPKTVVVVQRPRTKKPAPPPAPVTPRDSGQASKEDVVARCWRASEFMAKGMAPMEAARELALEAKISFRQAKRYVSRVRARWEAEEVEARPAHRAHLVKFLWETAKEARLEGKYDAAVSAAKAIGKVTGLEVTTVVNSGTSPTQQAIEAALAMTPLERAKLEAELEAELAAEGAGGPTP